MHGDPSGDRPLAERILRNAEVLGRLGGFHVFGQLGHGNAGYVAGSMIQRQSINVYTPATVGNACNG